MWSTREVKDRGLFFFKKNYWLTVLISLIITALVGESGVTSIPTLIFDFNTTSSSSGSEDGMFSGFPFDWAALTDFLGIFSGVILIVAFIASIFSVLMKVFLLSPLEVGGCSYMYKTLYTPGKFLSVIDGFRQNYFNTVKVMFFRDLYIFLWSLLFVIPGIVKIYEYRLVPYIMSECPDISKDDALRLSSIMMRGHKWHALGLDLSFLGWILLSVCTCGILSIFYVNPYVHMTNAALYDRLKTLYNEKYTVTAEEIN